MWIAIGKLSERSGVKVETIRYYERIGLLPAPVRTEGRHRLYGADDIQRLIFLRRGRELGFAIDAMRELLALAARGRNCAEVREMALAHAGRIRERIVDLEGVERLLLDTAARCERGQTTDCPILEVLRG